MALFQILIFKIIREISFFDCHNIHHFRSIRESLTIRSSYLPNLIITSQLSRFESHLLMTENKK